jgi:hypothetical protein
MNRPVHGIPTPRTPRVMNIPRTCRDCSGTYYYTDTHTNPRYCPQCLPGHTRICQVCQRSFPVENDTDQRCPIHVTHPALF